MFDPIFEKIKRENIVFIFLFISFLIFLFINFLNNFNKKVNEVYFFDIGQGDSQLINIKEGSTDIQILIDGGPLNGKVLSELSKALDPSDKYIDIVILSHPDIDHFGGLINVLENYRVGVFIYNGQHREISTYLTLLSLLDKNEIKIVSLDKGDYITYKSYQLKFLYPNSNNLSDNINENSLVFKLNIEDSTILFTGDIGEVTEKIISRDISSDVLKVPHHGSKFSSSPDFLRRVSPKVSIIQVGDNRFGHPTEEVLDRLSSIGSKVFRNDLNGTIKIELSNNKLNIYNENSK